MSKVVMDEEVKQQQLNLKKSVTNLINNKNTFIYKVNWDSPDVTADEIGEIVIRYREHSEVEIT